MTRSSLTAKQQRFAEEYLVDLNATQAARRAGYSPNTAADIGRQLIRKTPVAVRIQAAMAERSARTEITQDRVLKEVARLAFLDIRKAFNADGTMKPLHEMDDDTAAALAGLDAIEQREDGALVGTIKKLKLSDKKGALELLMRHMGMLNDKMRVQGDTENPIALLVKQCQGSALPVVANPPPDDDE
ncbi:terminase small subunit [Ancylobacter sp. WKF20]|uniref:terminase small subunit n=1 Tax=Ancylobacter sp. WKF20 TaxID=3039801 RepID=UPI00243432D1|nr:terminase small subunit [Ancylobacter sp. WKF20]WGD29877.1 terminase small subunit [Ancylobacter sp. WKF20]